MRVYNVIPPVSCFPSLDFPLYEGEMLKVTLARALMNGAPIDSSSEVFYDDEDDVDSDDFSVDPVTDIRTDRFAVAEHSLYDSPRSTASHMTSQAESNIASSVVPDSVVSESSVSESSSLDS